MPARRVQKHRRRLLRDGCRAIGLVARHSIRPSRPADESPSIPVGSVSLPPPSMDFTTRGAQDLPSEWQGGLEGPEESNGIPNDFGCQQKTRELSRPTPLQDVQQTLDGQGGLPRTPLECHTVTTRTSSRASIVRSDDGSQATTQATGRCSSCP